MGAWLSLGHARGQHYGDPRLRADRGWRWSGNDYRIKWPGHRFWSTRPGTVWGWQEIRIQVRMSITWKVHFILIALFLCRHFICFLVRLSFHSINVLLINVFSVFMPYPHVTVFTFFWVVIPCSLGGVYQPSGSSCFYRDSVVGVGTRLWTRVSRVGI